ncbi:hypothetical protein BLOT_000003 [Blomia tropicalis]|nr:hypothetical protein BLOT_000003 [Blomia tropicalis]
MNDRSKKKTISIVNGMTQNSLCKNNGLKWVIAVKNGDRPIWFPTGTHEMKNCEEKWNQLNCICVTIIRPDKVAFSMQCVFTLNVSSLSNDDVGWVVAWLECFGIYNTQRV